MKKSITLFKYIKLLSYLKNLQGLKALESLLDIFYLLYIANLSCKKTSKTRGMRVKKVKKREYYGFTSKELDEETGLYYFGARYLDPQTSRWISSDPAFGSYLPRAGQSGSNLPGQGGVYNPINLNPYGYSGNNPIVYKDPDGRFIRVPTPLLLLYKALTSKNNTNPQLNVKSNPATSNNNSAGGIWKVSTDYRVKDEDCSKYWGGQPYHTGIDYQVFDANGNNISKQTYFRAPVDGTVFNFVSSSNTIYIYDESIKGYWEFSHGQDNSFKIDTEKTMRSKSPNPTKIMKGDIIALIGNKGLDAEGDKNIHLHVGIVFFNKKYAEEYVKKNGGKITETHYGGGTQYYVKPPDYGKFMNDNNKNNK